MADREIDEGAIRRRAYEISQGDDAGSGQENWERAERELREASGNPPAKDDAETTIDS